MKITYSNEVLNAYSGQINCEAGIFVDGEIVGVAQYVLYDDELTISDIFVRPAFRRQGFGSRLMKYIQQENPDYHYKPSLKTELGAKFVHKEIGLDEGMSDILKESLKDVLKPKDPQSIMSHFKQKYNFNVLQTEFLTYPYLDEYFKDFYFEKDLYVKNTKWSKYATQGADYLQSRSLPRDYQTIDITKEAKETIIQSTKNIKTKKPLKALQFNWANFGDLDSLRRFFNDMNIKNGVNGDNPLWKHMGDNDAFKWIYEGKEYSYLGNSDGFALFIVPDDFIKKFFGVNESISDILKPKSIEDIKQSVIELVENLEETQNAAEFIDQTSDEDGEVCQELEDLCAAMGSDPGNVEFIIEESHGFEEIQKLTNIIDEKSHSQRNSVARAEHPLTYENMSYRVNPVAKLAWGYPTDFNGMNIIFFDYPQLLRSIKKVEFAWEKYQI